MTINGYLDALANNSVRGWAGDDSGDTLNIAVYWSGVRVGMGRTDLYRPDIGRDVGYCVAVPEIIDAVDFLAGRAWVEAIASNDQRYRLPLAHVAGFLELALTRHLRSISGVELREMIGRVMLSRDRAFLDRTPAAIEPRANTGDTSLFSLAVGTLTPDGEVIVGKDGHLFLITGSNGLIGQYVREDGIETIADHWVDHFTRRFRALQRRNIQYVQLIVPEKASVLADELPFHIDPPIPL